MTPILLFQVFLSSVHSQPLPQNGAVPDMPLDYDPGVPTFIDQLWNFWPPSDVPKQQPGTTLIEDFVTFAVGVTDNADIVDTTAVVEATTDSDVGHNVRAASDKSTTGITYDHINVDPDHMSPTEFSKWLNGIHHQEGNDKEINQDTQTVDNGTIESSEIRIDASHDGSTILEHGLSKNILIVIVTSGATVSLCIVMLITVCYLKRRATDSDKCQQFESNIAHQEPTLRGLSIIETKGCDLFMGIPTNNEIWKNLQTLPRSASDNSVSDSEKP